MKTALALLVTLAASSGAAAAPAGAPPAPIPAGAYKLDPAHASVTFRVDHLGFSHYTASFSRLDANLQLDPRRPEAAVLEVRIDPRSLTLPTPPPGFTDEITGPHWLDAAKYPEMRFRSTRVERTGPGTARITGDFTLHGVTRPLTLEATFNGGWRGFSMDPHARAGFSAHGALNRSDYGVSAGVPAPGTKLGVSDRVEIAIEAEFTGPPISPSPAPR